MKFLPENKKKTIRSLILLAISVAGIVYFNFFSGPNSKLNPAGTVYPPADPARESGASAPAGGAPLPFTSAKKAIGDKIDTSILESEDFQALRSVPDLLVRPDELGKTNPFGR